MLIIDTETTGLRKTPDRPDRVLEIGIAELNEMTGEITPVYNELIRYPDFKEFVDHYEKTYEEVWILHNTDMRVEDILTADKDLPTVMREVREIVRGKVVTSYNVPFDFGKFLNRPPWYLGFLVAVKFDIMDKATEEVRRRAKADEIPDKQLQKRLLDEWKYHGDDKWVRSLDAYKVLCPDDPAGREGVQTHRALDDAIMEAHILKAMWKWHYDEGEWE